MSTVLWANVWIEGVAHSDQEDRDALYRHADDLDRLARRLGLPSFSKACDTTDLRYNFDEAELPDGMTSTTEVMAASGQWLARAEAERLLDGLLAHIEANDVRFGLLRNRRGEVVRELAEVRGFLASRAEATKFNFSVVG